MSGFDWGGYRRFMKDVVLAIIDVVLAIIEVALAVIIVNILFDLLS